MSYSLLQNFKSENFKTEPFPHIIIKNALPTKLYDELLEKYPVKKFQEMLKYNNSNERLDLMFKNSKKKKSLHIWDELEIPSCWKNFFLENTGDKFKNKFRDIFGKAFKDKYNKIFPNNDFIYSNIAVSANSPVKEKSNKVRSAHLDQPSKLYTGLFYLRDKNDNTPGGDLDLLTWNKDITDNIEKSYLATKSEIDTRNVNVFKTIKYENNTFVIFLNSINSLHGVTERSVTSFIRKFCVLTGTLNYTLFQKGISRRDKIKRFFKKLI